MMSAARRVRIVSAEHRAKVSAAMRAAWARPEVRIRMLMGMRAAWAQPDSRARRVAAMRAGSVPRPESRAQASRALWARPDMRVRMMTAQRAAVARLDERARKSAVVRANWARPEIRARMLHTPRTKEKISRTMKGKPKSEQMRAKLSATLRRRLEDPILRQLAVERVLANAGSRRYEFLDRKGRLHNLRSQPERQYAEALDRAGLDWWYERDRLLLSTGVVYVPDFYVEQWASYVEIKGRGFSTEKTEQAIRDGHPVLFIHITGTAMFSAALRFLAPLRARA